MGVVEDVGSTVVETLVRNAATCNMPVFASQQRSLRDVDVGSCNPYAGDRAQTTTLDFNFNCPPSPDFRQQMEQKISTAIKETLVKEKEGIGARKASTEVDINMALNLTDGNTVSKFLDCVLAGSTMQKGGIAGIRANCDHPPPNDPGRTLRFGDGFGQRILTRGDMSCIQRNPTATDSSNRRYGSIQSRRYKRSLA